MVHNVIALRMVMDRPALSYMCINTTEQCPF